MPKFYLSGESPPSKSITKKSSICRKYRHKSIGAIALSYPPFVIDDSSWKNVAESFAVALTLTLGGYESAIAPNYLH